MSYRVIFNFDDGTSEDILGEEYDTYEEAEEAAEQAASDYAQGNSYLEEAGESHSGAEIDDWDIEKV